MPELLDKLVEAAEAAFNPEVVRHRGEVTLRVAPDMLVEMLTWLRDDAPEPLPQLVDISAVDGAELGWSPRFRVSYHLLRPGSDLRVRVQADAVEGEKGPSVPTVTGLWEAADWNEREVWDLMGVRFEGHPDLRRILQHDDTDQGHPLQKQVPLMGTWKEKR